MKTIAFAFTALALSIGTVAARGFDGFYAGVLVSSGIEGRDSYPANAGVLAGYRFSPTDPVRLGVEGRVSAGLYEYWNASLSGVAGIKVEDNSFLFAKAGGAYQSNVTTGADFDLMPLIGAGVEFAPNDSLILRAETTAFFRTDTPTLRLYAIDVSFGVLKPF